MKTIWYILCFCSFGYFILEKTPNYKPSKMPDVFLYDHNYNFTNSESIKKIDSTISVTEKNIKYLKSQNIK